MSLRKALFSVVAAAAFALVALPTAAEDFPDVAAHGVLVAADFGCNASVAPAARCEPADHDPAGGAGVLGSRLKEAAEGVAQLVDVEAGLPPGGVERAGFVEPAEDQPADHLAGVVDVLPPLQALPLNAGALLDLERAPAGFLRGAFQLRREGRQPVLI